MPRKRATSSILLGYTATGKAKALSGLTARSEASTKRNSQPQNVFTGIPQEFGKNVGRFEFDLPHGRDENKKHKPSNDFETEFAPADLQLHS
jgi:hypothetical protein